MIGTMRNPINSPCFIAGTPVWTDKGLVPIDKIKAGDLVLSRCEITGTQGFKRVSRISITPEQGLWSVEAGDSYLTDVILTTASHLFAVRKDDYFDKEGWQIALELEGGQLLASPDNNESLRVGFSRPVYATTANKNEGFLIHNPDDDVGCVVYTHPEGQAFEFENSAQYLHGVKIRLGASDDQYLDGHVREDYPDLYLATVYEIEVEEFQTYFVGKNGILVRSGAHLV
jgi:hypothetical protein